MPTPGSPTIATHLSVAGTGELLGATQLLQLRVPAHEPREAAPSGAWRRVRAGPAPVIS